MNLNLDFINNLLNSRLKRNVFSAVSKTEVKSWILQNRLYYEDSASAADALPAEPDAESLAGSQLVTEI